jgi:hypothetical protein
MNCGCYERVKQKLREKTGDENTDLNYGFVELGKEIEGKQLLELAPIITASYRDKKKDGTFKKKMTNLNIIASFCPFCGTKINDDSNKGGTGNNETSP